jgi:predicted MPP superfamily phosphohydrolase
MFFLVVYGLFLSANLLLYLKLRRGLRVWFPGRDGKIAFGLALFFLLVNSPLLVAFFFSLERLPGGLLRWYFYPGYVWYAMLIAYVVVTAPKDLLWGAARGLRWAYRRLAAPAGTAEFSPSRRQFLAGMTPVLPSALLGTAAYGVYGTAGELEVSPEIPIPVRNLPRQLDGFRITQLSDIHFGPYMRERDMAPVVEAANGLRSEVIVITGDILDRSLSLLPEAASSLSRLRAPHGVYAILGNHDYYSDQRSPRSGYRGCDRMVAGIEPAGVRFLRNSHASIVVGGAEVLLAGLDWLGPTRGDPNVYEQQRTQRALETILRGTNPEAVRVLLSHHPHSFIEAIQFGCPLTLAGHTHGGGQVVLGYIEGVPVGLASLRFRYVRGLYQEQGCSLYVNRGIGYFGIPIRINCLPEISRFRLVRA